MKCFKCKKEIENTDRFCPYCGAKQGFEADVIERAIQGESRAQEELYNATYSDVYYTIFAITKDEDLLFDVLQDTYLTAFQKLDQLKNADSFRPWIKRIAHNKTLNALRDRKPSKMTFLVSADTEEVIEIKDDRIENMPEEKMDQNETVRLVKEILDALPEDQRVVIGMYYFEQMSINEIAEELGCSGNTIKSRLNYGRKKIETQVLELEKKGTKLYSLAPIPFFLWLLLSLRKQPDEKVFDSVRNDLQNLPVKTQMNSEVTKTAAEKVSVTEGGTITGSGSAAEIGKATAAVGKGLSVKMLAGIAAVAVVAGTAGYMTTQRKNNDTAIEQDSEQTESQEPTETETIAETQSESQTDVITETQTETETVVESETETETQTEKKTETALNSIENLGYTYIGGTNYDVTYQMGYPYQENGPEAGINLDAAPTGVAGAMKRDMDGDGKEELLLAVLKPADQVYLKNGKKDAKLYFEVYSEEEGEWSLQGETTEEQAYAVHLTEVIPNIKAVCNGTTIYVKENGYGTFPADAANNGEKYEYNGAGFTALSNSDMGYTDGNISEEIVNAVMNSSAEDLVCEFIVPEIYEQGNYDLLSTLYGGAPLSVTMEFRDNGWVASDSVETSEYTPEQEEESVTEAEANVENDHSVYDETLALINRAYEEKWDVDKTGEAGVNTVIGWWNLMYPDDMTGKLTYTYMDLDDDGRDELLLGSQMPVYDSATDTVSYKGNGIYNIYSVINGRVEKVFEATYRQHGYITSDKLICYFVSGGAGYHEFTVYKFEDNEMQELEKAVQNMSSYEPIEQLENKYPNEFDISFVEYTKTN